MRISMNLFQRPDNGIWYVRISSRKRISLHTKDEREAKRLYAEIRKNWLAGKLAHLENRPADKSLSDFVTEYLDYSENHDKARNTMKCCDVALRYLMAHVGPHTPLTSIGRRDIDTWMSSLNVKKTSVNCYFRHIRAALNQAVAWGYLKESPCKGVKEIRCQKSSPRYLDQEEITRLLAAETDHRFLLLWKFLLLTGCRRNEALQLQARDINWQQRTITVTNTKTKVPKTIRITSALAEVLQNVPQVGLLWPWHEGTVSARFKLTASKAGIKCRLHDLRHTFASHLVMAGVDIYTVSHLLGHSRVSATEIYAHLSREHLDEALEKWRIGD